MFSFFMRTLNLLPHYFKNIHHFKIGSSIKYFIQKYQSFKSFFYKLFSFLMRTLNLLTHYSNWYMSINKYEIQYRENFRNFKN